MQEKQKEIINLLKESKQGLIAKEVAEKLAIGRSSSSRYLNELYKEQQISKKNGRPVIYFLPENRKKNIEEFSEKKITFDSLVGVDESLKVSIQQAKAAVLYPPRGLHTIIFGETGTGKSLFAECMYHFAVNTKILSEQSPFVSFNCADYAQNSHLLFAHIFGVKKGAYTGATADSKGLITKADGGILFLDEIHRLPPEGQEMLFMVIDKGSYRPLGESERSYQANVQLICATTETSEVLLQTFNRRIPMVITLPPLATRSLDERYEIISLFIKQEANRLNLPIDLEREVVLAFMLYNAEGNIGQVKRDLKLVCAKAFLHYKTHGEKKLTIHKYDLPLQVQKGLLKVKELPNHLVRFVDSKMNYLTFKPGNKDIVWAQDPTKNMQIYQEIEEKIANLSTKEMKKVDLEQLITKDVEAYFQTYVNELTQYSIHKELIPESFWNLTNQLYDIAEKKLDRKYEENARFAFALHLQSTMERIKKNHRVIHPDLNSIRKNMKKEFQVAIDLASIIEEKQAIEIPFDEIGFICMFLAINVNKEEEIPKTKVAVIVLMHGGATATSMLKTAQEILEIKYGIAMNLPLTMDVQLIYEQLRNYVLSNRKNFTKGILLLTDMGSLNSFGTMIYEETKIPTKVVTLTSTMVVLEAIRMANIGKSLSDIYQSIQLIFENNLLEQFDHCEKTTKKKKIAIIVTCFTGEGVAAKLHKKILSVIDENKVEIIQMQFIEKDVFKKRIKHLTESYDIRAIVGTVDIGYQKIPFFSALDIFNHKKLNYLKCLVNDEWSVEKIVASLQQTITSVTSLEQLILLLQKIVCQIQKDMHCIIRSDVEMGIIIHLAFLVDSLLTKKKLRVFSHLTEFIEKYHLEVDIIQANIMILEKNYQIIFPIDEIAYLIEIFHENKLKETK